MSKPNEHRRQQRRSDGRNACGCPICIQDYDTELVRPRVDAGVWNEADREWLKSMGIRAD